MFQVVTGGHKHFSDVIRSLTTSTENWQQSFPSLLHLQEIKMPKARYFIIFQILGGVAWSKIMANTELSAQNRKSRAVITSLLTDKVQPTSQHTKCAKVSTVHQHTPPAASLKGSDGFRERNTDFIWHIRIFDWKIGCQWSFWGMFLYGCLTWTSRVQPWHAMFLVTVSADLSHLTN